VVVFVEPAAQWTLKGLLRPLLPVVGCLVALGLIKIVDSFLRAFFGFEEDTLGRILGLFGSAGHWVQSKITAAEQKATNELGKAAHALEGVLADYLNDLGVAVAALGHEIMGGAIAFWVLTQWLVHGVKVAALGPRLDERLRHDRAIGARVKRLEHSDRAHARALDHPASPPIAAGIHTRLKPIATHLNHIGAVELPGIRARQRVAERTIPQDIAGLRARVREAENGVEHLWQRVRHLDRVTTGVLAGALVATALGRLGMGWLRCSNWRRIGRLGCRIPAGLLEGLLGDALEAFVVADLCDFMAALSTAVREVEPLLEGLVVVEGALIGCRGATAPAEMATGPLDLPPVSSGLTLAL